MDDHHWHWLPWDRQVLDDAVLQYMAIRAFQARMPHAHRALSDASLRIDRAEKHLAELKTEIDEWREEQKHNHPVAEAHTGGRTVKLVGGPPMQGPKPEWGAIVGEVVYNLRAALDYIVYGLAWLDSGRDQSDTQFLIEDCGKMFKRRRNRRLNGISDEHVAAIKRLQPFEGCTWTADLRTLSNRDKHRTLNLVVAQGSITANFVYPEGEAEGGDPESREVKVEHHPTLEVMLENEAPALKSLENLASEVRAVVETFQPSFSVAFKVPMPDWVMLAMRNPIRVATDPEPPHGLALLASTPKGYA